MKEISQGNTHKETEKNTPSPRETPRENPQEKIEIVNNPQTPSIKYILGIETSCDETAAAVVDSNYNILSNVIASQDIHKLYGGVVPELASRAHVDVIDRIVNEAIVRAGIKLKDITAIAATTHPGLPGAVLVGHIFGKALAVALGIPFVSVNHVLGHIASNFYHHNHLALVVSGGHTAIYSVESKNVKLLETTLDDAVGECFDKVARHFGLPYPGGPEIAKLASGYQGELIKFVANPNYARHGFSYSGLKTAVMRKVERDGMTDISQLAASFQHETVSQLVNKCVRWLKKTGVKTLCVSGGVSANIYLRQRLSEECEKIETTVHFPDIELCGDNAAMIASACLLDLQMI